MPYTNVPEELQGKMEDCVMQVMDKNGGDKEAAIAICYASVVEGKMLDITLDVDALKVGARNSSKDSERLQTIHDLAVENGASCPEKPGPIVPKSAKTEDAPDNTPTVLVYGAVKAVGDWELDVLGIPYGGPNAGRDSDGEHFSEKTNLELSRFGKPLITYYHGLTPEGKPQGEPEIIGEAVSYERKSDGVWWRVILDKTNALAQRVWDAAKQGTARASSGSIAHLVRKARDGHITNWPVIELTLIDATGKRQPSNQYAVALPVAQKTYQKAGHTMPQLEIIEMDETELKQFVADAVKAQQAEAEAQRAAQATRQAEIDAAIKAEREKWEAEAAPQARLSNAPYVTKYNDSKFDNLEPGEHAFLIQVAEKAHRTGRMAQPISDAAVKSLAGKIESEATKGDAIARKALKALHGSTGAAIKANEINYSTLASYGDEWVGVQYQRTLWEKIRANTWILQELERGGDVREVPEGFESDVVPLESTDPTWYKVAQATADTSGRPDVTVTDSKIGTAQKAITLAKMGCRVEFTGEMVEDSLIRWVPNAYRQIQVSGAEQMEYALIDGDTETGASTNINDIAGTPAASNLFLMVNGFRKLALVTNTANSRDGGVLDVNDFLETVKLMGTAGLGGSDPTKVSFIIDPWTYWKALELEEVKTRDVFSQATIESGQLTGLWGYPVKRSYFMHYAGVALGTVTTAAYQLKANSAGKVDQDTEANNTKGAILAVRWDQWALRWKRRMTLEMDRWPESDTNQIVAMMRWGLGYRDTEASAITYNVTV